MSSTGAGLGANARLVIGGDAPKRALVLLDERRGEFPYAAVRAVHDRGVVECPAEPAESVGAWLRRAMEDARVPAVAVVTVGPTWADKL